MELGIVYEGAAGVRAQTPTVTVVGAPADGIVAAALDLVRAGARRIELCGGLGPLPQAQVQDAVGVPVGAVMFGFESLEAVTDYKLRFAAGETLGAAFLWRDTTPVRVEHPDGTFAAVPDDETAARVARELADEGLHLVELYGGLDAHTVTRIHEATDTRLAVGVALHAQPCGGGSGPHTTTIEG